MPQEPKQTAISPTAAPPEPNNINTRLRQRFVVCIALIVQAICFSGCNTVTTLDPRAVNQQGQTVDETANHYGQSYFLPKGLIHLVIKPEGGGAPASDSGETSPAPATPKKSKSAAPVSPEDPPGATEVSKEKEEAPTTKEDDLIPPKAYAITATRVIVPDQSRGPFTVRYNTNWFYSDNLSVGVTDDGLLTTLTSDLSDRTSQVIYNMADTAANIAKTMAYLAALRTPQAETAKSVRYRRLNIDITFDPFDNDDLTQVRNLFRSIETEKAIYVSPFQFDVRRVKTEGMPGENYCMRARDPKTPGLWFRELTPVEIILTANNREYIRMVGVQRHRPISPSRDKADIDSEIKRLQAKPPPDNAPPEKIAEYKKALQDLRDAKEAEKGVSSAELAKAEKTAVSQQISRTARLVVSVPNKQRTFAFNIPRSAFVQNKKLNLTINSGLLTKVELVKPSEAEGFSQIPLTISQKILDLPKQLLTIRTEKLTAARDQTAAANAAFNNQSQLDQSMATREAALEKAKLNAERDRLQAEIDLLQKQRALIQAQNAGSPPIPGPASTPTP